MNLNHYTNLEIAKKMDKLGWIKRTEHYHCIPTEVGEKGRLKHISAPLATEILEELPKAFNQDDLHLNIDFENEEIYCVNYINIHTEITEYSIQNKSFVDALGEMWCLLKKKGII